MTSFLSSQGGGGAAGDAGGGGEGDFVVLSEEPSLISCCLGGGYKKVNKIRPFPLGDLEDLQVQQGLIIKDLLFSVLGHEGNYIRFSEKYLSGNMHSRIKGPDFKIAKHLDILLKSMTKKLVKYGKYYTGICGFLEVYDKPEYGRVMQKLCHLLAGFAERYQRLICRIEDEFHYNANFKLTTLENILSQEIYLEINHLYEIVSAIHAETTERRQPQNQDRDAYFNHFMQSIQNDLRETGNIDISADGVAFNVCKGSLVLKIVQDRINKFQGDIPSSTFLTSIFDSISAEYVVLLNEWLIKGEIDDPFDEFLVKKNEIPSTMKEVINVKTEKYWEELFTIRTDGLIDQLSSKDLQLKILSTGKYLNIFKTCTGISDFDHIGDNVQAVKSLYAQDLELRINLLYKRANDLILKLLFEGYDIITLICELQTTFMFRDSSKIDQFLDKSYSDLHKSKHSISTSKLAKSYRAVFQQEPQSRAIGIEDKTKTGQLTVKEILKSTLTYSVDVTNFYDLAKEILNVKSFDAQEALKSNTSSNTFKQLLGESLKRNQVTSADSNVNLANFDPDHSDEYTITGAHLEANIPFPYNIILNQSYMFEYQLVFKLQMIVKFVNKLLDNTWKEVNYSNVWRFPGYDERIKKWLLRCRVLHNRMKDFMNELQFYLNYDIIEPNFKRLEQNFSEAKSNLSKLDSQAIMNGGANTGTNSFSGYKRGNLGNYNHNNVFDEKIHDQIPHSSHALTDEIMGVSSLVRLLDTFLNNILRDSLVTNKVLIDVLKNMFDVIILYNHYLGRLKKTLVLLNNELFEQFSKDYPEKFEGKEMSEDVVEKRFVSINKILNSHFEIFSDSLNEFIITLKSYGNLENQLFLILIERLEHCFPDH